MKPFSGGEPMPVESYSCDSSDSDDGYYGYCSFLKTIN